MATVFLPLMRLLLAVVIAVTSVHLAAMRGTAGTASVWVEFCGGDGPALITLDSDGAPVDAHPECLDCVIAAAVLLPQAAHVARPETATLHLATLPPSQPAPRLRGMKASARGPPLTA